MSGPIGRRQNSPWLTVSLWDGRAGLPTLRSIAQLGIGSVVALFVAASSASAYPVVLTSQGPPIAAPEMAAATPSAELRGIGSDGGEGVWFSDIENGTPYDPAYLTHYSPSDSGLTRINLNTPFPLEHSYVNGVAPGLHGEEWFAQQEQNLLSHITPTGKLVNKTLPAPSEPGDVAVDKQGNVWFTEGVGGHGCSVGRRSPTGKLTTYNIGGECLDLTVGPDGNIWVAANVVKELSATTGATLASYSVPLPIGIATLGDDIYVTEDEPGRIAQIGPSGEVTEYALPGDHRPEWMTAGPDGAVWFTEPIGPVAGSEGIGRLTPNGELSEIPVGEYGPAGIAATNDAIYFTQGGPDAGVMRIPLSNFVEPENLYVALGDSYSSGEGNPPYEQGTDKEEETPDLCHRSPAAYGPRLDNGLDLGPMSFKACSGAVTNDIFQTSGANLTEPAQLSWLRPDTKTVTLTIGGNDAGFPWVLEHCVSALPVPNNFGCSANTGLEVETQARLDALAGGAYATTPKPLYLPIHSVLSVIQAIHSHASSARMVVGLYPMLFGRKKASYALNIAAPGRLACEVGNFLGVPLWIGYKDAQWLNKLGEQLNTIIKNAVGLAAHEKIAVTYASPSQFGGHDFCDESELWFHPLELKIAHLSELGPELKPKSSSFHPTEAGQLLGYETAFAEKLN